MARKSPPKQSAVAPRDPAAPTPVVWSGAPEETDREIAGRKIVSPFTRHAFLLGQANGQFTSRLKAEEKPGGVEFAVALKAIATKMANGEKGSINDLLAAQAVTLDTLFTEYARVAVSHLDTPGVTDRYLRLALKAQTSSRAALEALAKLHQPREQIVRHVHVYEGGQAVVADEFHHHAGGSQNGKAAEQPHAAGTGAAGESAAVPRADTVRHSLPGAGRARQGEMQDARRGQGKRRTQGKP